MIYVFQVMMEVVAVSSAIYGLVLSMIICITAVAIFTGHVVLLLIIVFTILGKYNILFYSIINFNDDCYEHIIFSWGSKSKH